MLEEREREREIFILYTYVFEQTNNINKPMKTSLSPAPPVIPTAEDLFFGTTGMALRAAGIQLLSGNVRQPDEAVGRRTQ